MKIEKLKSKGLPKFDSTGWLSIGIFFSLMLVVFSLASILTGNDLPFFPFTFSNILGIVLGLGLGIHCADMIVYHRNRKKALAKENISNNLEFNQDNR